MNDTLRDLKIAHIRVATNVRTGPLEVDELAADIKAHGLLQPLCVRRTGDSGYELITGHRRLEACKQLGMDTVPCLITDGHDTRRVLLQLAENVQRQDLRPYDVAEALRKIRDRCDSVTEVARRVNRSYSWAEMHLQYAKLYDELREAGADEKFLKRIPFQNLCAFRGVAPAERLALIKQFVPADDVSPMPSRKQIVDLLAARKAKGKGRPTNREVTFRVMQHGLSVVVACTTKYGANKVVDLLVRNGGTRA